MTLPMKLSRGDEKWAEASSSVAGLILMFDLVLLGAGIACLALGWSARGQGRGASPDAARCSAI